MTLDSAGKTGGRGKERRAGRKETNEREGQRGEGRKEGENRKRKEKGRKMEERGIWRQERKESRTSYTAH